MILLNYSLIAFGFLSTSFFLFDNASMESRFDIILLGFWAWAIIPYLIFANKHFTKTKIEKFLISSAVIITVFGGLFIYYDGFHVHLDALNGLLFIFIPAWQNVLTVILCGSAIVIRLFSKKKRNRLAGR